MSNHKKESKNHDSDKKKVMSDEKLTENLVEQEGAMEPESTDNSGENILEKLEKDVHEAKDKYLRLYSEFDNFKKRSTKERMDLLKSANTEVLISLLPIADDFERAIKAGPLPEGIDLIYNKLISTLNQKGVKAMESKGKDFDPDLHDAITSIPAENDSMKNKVIEEVEKGYYLHDKVLRHAKVIVGS